MARLIVRIKYTGIFLGLLLVCPCAIGQQPFADSLQQKFIRYQLQRFQEKMFVHTDRSFYLQGEIIWFKIYNVDESFNLPAGISKVAYVEVLNDEQKPVLQAKIAMQDGEGDGSFIVPSSVVSGSYKLRCYTSRMKNFGADYFFEKPLTIVNTLKQPVLKSSEPSARYHIDFFPEGGNLVNGLRSVVAFKVTDQYGNGIDAHGYITNDKKDTLGHFSALRFGMGSFVLEPHTGDSYHAVLIIKDTVIAQGLPSVYDEGYVMRLTEDSAAGQLRITVSATNKFLHQPVYLFVHSRQVVKQSLAAQIENGAASFIINKNNLGDGISALTVFNADRQPVCERLYFKRPVRKLVITPAPLKDNYTTRNKVTLDLQTADQSAQAVAADMSVAVFMIDSFQTTQYEDIHTWLLLQSELGGKVEAPSWYLQQDCPPEAINNLMLTQGWRRFKWEDILQNRLPSFEFVTENEGPVITGMVSAKRTGRPLDHIPATLTVPGQVFEMRSAFSQNNGQIFFNLNNFYSGNEVIVQASNPADSTAKIDIAHPFAERFSATPFQPFKLNDKWKNQLLLRSINAQAETAYLLNKKRYAFLLPPADTVAFYGKPEKQYYLDDYTRFTTMEEVMKEFVAEVRVRKQADKFQFRVVHAAFKEFFEQDPLVLIDGLPIYDINRLMALDPLVINKIEVVTHQHYLGSQISEGIVHFKSYRGDLGGYELDPNAVIIEYEGLQRQRIFYSPVYETNEQKESRIPDVRNLLYWSPAVKTAADGKQQISFFTSDTKASFAVVVQGISATGLSGSSVLTFTVDK